MSNLNKPAIWFWILAIVFLLWNLMGVMHYFSVSGATPEQMAQGNAKMTEYFTLAPKWMWHLLAVSVFTGVLACVSLLLRKSWAIPLAVISFLAAFFNDAYAIISLNAFDYYDSTMKIMTAVVFILCLLLVVFAISSKRKNWIG